MASNKLFTNIITGTAIIASLTTGGMAGMKVLASRNIDTEIPEINVPSPDPSATPSSSPTTNINTGSDSMAPVSKVSENNVVAGSSPSPTIIPSVFPSSSDFPLASSVPGGKFDDDDMEDELEHEEEREREDKDEIETEDHEDN